jgi:signal transduction histidine kinase
MLSESDGKKGKISISTRRKGENVIIRVSDTGPGVPEAIRHRIFDPFYTTKEPGKGTGQGLAIAFKFIVDHHKGSIEVEDKKGDGTTFIIQLPLQGNLAGSREA